MQRPIVNIAQQQSVESTEVNISNEERERLLSKYGHININQEPTYNNNLSFEEMVQQDLKRAQNDAIIAQQNRNQPKPKSFNNINYSETKYSNLNLENGSSFEIKVQIQSDMKI